MSLCTGNWVDAYYISIDTYVVSKGHGIAIYAIVGEFRRHSSNSSLESMPIVKVLLPARNYFKYLFLK